MRYRHEGGGGGEEGGGGAGGAAAAGGAAGGRGIMLYIQTYIRTYHVLHRDTRQRSKARE